MARQYLHTMFTEETRRLQTVDGSRHAYARMEADDALADVLGPGELAFIAARDSFYMATVNADGWPYIQHRGGEPGFLRHLSGNRLAFLDFRGNRQHVSEANLTVDDRVSLFLMDYPAQRRLKILGHASMVTAGDDMEMPLAMHGSLGGIVERVCLIDVVGFDWNCPQHITPRYTLKEFARAV